jgi:hypothetical protein
VIGWTDLLDEDYVNLVVRKDHVLSNANCAGSADQSLTRSKRLL